MQPNRHADWPPTRESPAEWMRRHSAVVGVFAVLAAAAVSVFSLVVAESRLRSLDGENNDRASSLTSPSIVARATTVPSGPPSPTGLAAGVLDATNTDRVNAGLAPLRWNSDLAGSAQLWAHTMADNGTLAYQDLTGILDLGYHGAAQNVLVGPAGISADAAEAGWMNSAPHQDSILSRDYTEVGIGVATSADGRVWIAVTFAG